MNRYYCLYKPLYAMKCLSYMIFTSIGVQYLYLQPNKNLFFIGLFLKYVKNSLIKIINENYLYRIFCVIVKYYTFKMH